MAYFVARDYMLRSNGNFFPITLIFVTELQFVFWIVRNNSNNKCYHSNNSTFQVLCSLLKYAKVDLSF